MARAGVTYEQVAQVINLLIANGQKPTINNVRELLGTGSPNTVLMHLQKWREAQPLQQKRAITLPNTIALAITQVIEQAEASARSEVEAKLVEAQTEASALLEAMEQAEQDYDYVNNLLHVTAQANDQLKEASIANQATIEALQTQLEQVKEERLIEKEQQAQLVAKLTQEADTLRVEVAKAQIKGEKASAAEKALSKEKEATSELKAVLSGVRATLEAQQSELVMLRTLAQANATRRARVEAARSRT